MVSAFQEFKNLPKWVKRQMRRDPRFFNGHVYSRKRSALMAAARAKGTHNKREWDALASVFGACVACGIPYSKLRGRAPTKDHIIPVNLGGCDCIANLQPVCRNCNSLGYLGDQRFEASPHWAKTFINRALFGWCEL